MAFLNKLKKVEQIVKDVKDNLTGRHLMFFFMLTHFSNHSSRFIYEKAVVLLHEKSIDQSHVHSSPLH